MTDRALVALVWRALLAAARMPAMWAAIGTEIAVFAIYLLVWGDGVPLVGARSVLEQFATLQWLFLAVALPWAAARSGAAGRRDDIAQLSALGAVRPSAVVTASVVALAVLLCTIAAAGLPFALLAQQISAAPAAALWASQLPLYALGVCAAAVTTACMLVFANRLFAWTVATALTLGVSAAAPQGASGGAALVAVGVVASVLLVSGADRRFWYLSEQA